MSTLSEDAIVELVKLFDIKEGDRLKEVQQNLAESLDWKYAKEFADQLVVADTFFFG